MIWEACLKILADFKAVNVILQMCNRKGDLLLDVAREKYPRSREQFLMQKFEEKSFFVYWYEESTLYSIQATIHVMTL